MKSQYLSPLSHGKLVSTIILLRVTRYFPVFVRINTFIIKKFRTKVRPGLQKGKMYNLFYLNLGKILQITSYLLIVSEIHLQLQNAKTKSQQEVQWHCDIFRPPGHRNGYRKFTTIIRQRLYFGQLENRFRKEKITNTSNSFGQFQINR